MTDTAISPRAGGPLSTLAPYFEKGPVAAFFLGMSSGFPFALIGANLTTRLTQDGIDRKSVAAFTLAVLVYSFKPLWAWVVDGVRLPILKRLGQRVSWLVLGCILTVAAVVNLALVDPAANLGAMVQAAILMGFAGATYDIVIDAYRIEALEPRQLGTGAGMAQYGWRIGSTATAALGLFLAARIGWAGAYLVCALFAFPAVIVGLVMGEPKRRRDAVARRGLGEIGRSIWGPFAEFLQRRGAVLVLVFILFHKIGDTLANLNFRFLLNDLGFSNDEIALWDVGVGFWATLIGIFIGGLLYARLGLKKSVIVSLIAMAISNLSFAGLAMIGHSNPALAATIGFENIASGIGSVTVLAYFSALCDLRFTAAQFALISAGSSIVGRLVNGLNAAEMIAALGYVNFYLMTTVLAVPGVVLFWVMIRTGMVDSAIGSAGLKGQGTV